jgi:hypothetical protein
VEDSYVMNHLFIYTTLVNCHTQSRANQYPVMDIQFLIFLDYECKTKITNIILPVKLNNRINLLKALQSNQSNAVSLERDFICLTKSSFDFGDNLL